MSREKFLIEVKRVFQILFLQKLIAMVLRAAWLGGAVYLLCWGSNQLWGWFPLPERWAGYAGLTAVLVLLSILLKRKPSLGFAWRLDQAFGLQEQFYTAYEGVTRPSAQPGTQAGLVFLLESEAVAQLPEIRKQIADRGWQLGREIGATVIILIQLLIVYIGSVYGIDRLNQDQIADSLPPIGREPTAGEVLSYLSTGGPDDGPSAASQGGGTAGISDRCDLDFSTDQWDTLGDRFGLLGDQLIAESVTFNLGESLLDRDYLQAANQFEYLADTIQDLSSTSRQRLADQFLTVSVAFQDAGMGLVASPFSEATAALLDGPNSALSERFDQLAVLMQQLAACQYGPGGNSLQVVMPIDMEPSLGNAGDFSVVDSGETPGGGEFFQPQDDEGFTGGSGSGIWPDTILLLEDYDLVEAYFPPR